jgi:integrase
MKAAFTKRPSASAAPRKIWDVAEVLQLLESWGPTERLSLTKLSWKTAMIVALISARRCSDLTLLRRDRGHLQHSDTRVVLQPVFGAKQDRPGHQIPPISFSLSRRRHLCPVKTIKEYLRRTLPRRGAGHPLFVTITRPHGPAAVSTIRRWIVMTLRAAGVRAPAGTTRAAAATYARASRIPLEKIMTAADWTRASTLYRHYTRQLPPEVLERMLNDHAGIQDAILPD